MNSSSIHRGSWLRTIFQYGKWYLLSSFLTKGVGVILLPIYTANLSTTEFGTLQTLNSIAALLPIILSCSLDSAFGRFFHNCKYDKNKLQNLYSSIYWFVLLYGSFILLIAFSTSSLWCNDILNIPVFPYVYLSFIPALLNQLAALGRTFLEQSLETRTITLLDFNSALINASVSIVLLLSFQYGIKSILIGALCSSLFLQVYYLRYFRKKQLLAFSIKFSVLKETLVYSIPLMPVVASTWIASVSDRLVIAKYVDLSSVAMYSFAFQISSMVYIIGDAVTRVISPVIMSGLVYEKEDTHLKMRSSSLFIWGVMLVFVYGLFLFSKELVTMLGNSEYKSTIFFIPILSFSYVLGMQQRFPSQVLSYHKKTWLLSAGAIIMALSNLTLNLMFVPLWGYTAAIFNCIIANLINLLWSLFWAYRYEAFSYSWGRMLLSFLCVIFLSLVSYGLIDIREIGFLNLLIKLIFLFIGSVIIMLVVDKNRIFLLISKMKNLKCYIQLRKYLE